MKLNIVMCASIVIAALGVIGFWVCGINKANDYAAWSIAMSGICAWIFLGCLWLHHRRQSWMA